MPFSAVKDIDQEKLKDAEKRLCVDFGVQTPHSFQRTAATHILDVPTGGGKTLAFWLPLYYHWARGDTAPESQHTIVVVGPISALLEAQANELRSKGISTAALTSDTASMESVLQDIGHRKIRVVLLGPEMAAFEAFTKKLASKDELGNAALALVIDEAHCISEWGTDDFRPEYRSLSILASRLPSGTPILAASATLPSLVLDDSCSRKPEAQQPGYTNTHCHLKLKAQRLSFRSRHAAQAGHIRRPRLSVPGQSDCTIRLLADDHIRAVFDSLGQLRPDFLG